MTDMTKAPSTERLREMLEAAEAATPGPWRAVLLNDIADATYVEEAEFCSGREVPLFEPGYSEVQSEIHATARHIANMDPPTSIAILRELIEARERIARLEGHVAPDCACPCCESERECSPDCTYSDDHPDLYEAMLMVRVAMYGKEANDGK